MGEQVDILHVCRLDKFIPSYMDFIRGNFPGRSHVFFVDGDQGKYPYKDGPDVYKKKGRAGYLKLFFLMRRSRKVILHSLFDSYVVALLFLCPWLLKKSYWVMWGGDYLHPEKEGKGLKSGLKSVMKRRVIKKMGNLVTYIPGSVDFARRQYGAGGTHHECLAYLSNVHHATAERRADGSINVLVGNSANPTNQHFDIFERIKPYIIEGVRLYVPLSYGDEDYGHKVMERGYELFGEQFVPMTDLMPMEEYESFLSGIDMAIFNHSRQQAMGTTISLLGSGKTVYMVKSLPSWRFLNDKGIRVNDIEDFSGFEGIGENENNKNAVKRYFSEDNLRRQWERIFDD